MKSESFNCGEFMFPRSKMEVRANELRVIEGARIVSIVFADNVWWLFYEPNVSEPVITKRKDKK